MFDRIAYVSRAAAGIGTRELYDIIRSAHNRNSASGLTGALVFLDGHFLQVLEGEGFRLEACLARIAADPRHEAFDLRSRVSAEQRLFPGEWMALRQRKQIEPVLRQLGAYAPGLPGLTGSQLEDFVRACCNQPVSH